MKTEINITDTPQDLDRYTSAQDLRQFYKRKGMDGLELMPCMKAELPEGLEPQDIVGIHLRYFPCWLEFWRGNTQALEMEYGNRETWEIYYGGSDREAFLKGWRDQLDLAQRTGAQYVVFHVAECTLQECITYRPLHSDLEVCLAAAEVINALLDGRDYSFYFLLENLWWSGLNLLDNGPTQALLDAIHYEKKGIMLDTGHLLNTNLNLSTQAEGLAYIHDILDRMGDLTRYIKGIHLNQSLSGAYVKKVLSAPPILGGTYWQKLSAMYPHIGSIDYHAPFTAPGLSRLIRRIDPEFLTYELISASREQHEQLLQEQLRAL